MKYFLLILFFTISEVYGQQTFNKLNVRDLDVTSKINVTSTTKSSKPCPAMTSTQRDAIASPLVGSCVYNTTSLELNIYDGTTWQTAGGGGIENWLTATAYDVDDVVIESNKIYQCEIAHTSGTFSTDLSGGKWVQLANDVSSSTGILPIANGGTGNTSGTATINANLTGPITSVGNATSIASQTGTGTTFVVQNSPALTTPNIGAANGASLELSGSFNSSRVSALNMLPNGDVELNDVTMFTCGSGNTCSRTTTAGEFSQNLAALKVATSAATLNVSQTVNTTSGVQKQGFMRIIYRIPAAVSDAQICTLVDAAEQTCVPSNRLVNNGLFQSIEVPLVFGSTSVGWKAKTTATNTQNFFFDGMVVGQGLGLQNLQGDTVYSASSGAAGAVTRENAEFINGNAVVSDTSLYTFTFNSGIFSTAPNCGVFIINGQTDAAQQAKVVSVSTTTVIIRTGYTDATNNFTKAAYTFTIVCQKTGNDYLAASSDVYSQANADFGATPVTYTLTNAGNATVTGTVSRQGEFAIFKGRISIGSTPPSGSITLNLPSGYVLSNTTNFTGGSVIGLSAGSYYTARAYPSTSTSVQFYGGATAVWNATVPGTWTSAGSNYIDFEIVASIVGWATAPTIVGSFAGVPAVPGYQGSVDTFKVSYGATATTACTSVGNCAYVDELTSTNKAVSTLAKTATGAYLMNLLRTYIKLKCTINSFGGGNFLGALPINVSNASSASFQTGVATTNTDSYGTIECTGVY